MRRLAFEFRTLLQRIPDLRHTASQNWEMSGVTVFSGWLLICECALGMCSVESDLRMWFVQCGGTPSHGTRRRQESESEVACSAPSSTMELFHMLQDGT
jgi:hypothetical protein